MFNVLNSQEITAIDNNYTFDSVQPIANVKCDVSAAGSSNPIGKLQSGCSQVAYVKTVDGRPVTVNPNWGRAVASTASFQSPLSLRVGLALTF